MKHRQLKIFHNAIFDKWHDGYQKCKAQKEKIKEEILPVLGIYQDSEIGVFLKTRKMRQNNCEHKDRLFFCP